MLLVALVTAGVWFWVRALTEDRPAFAMLGFFVFAGLGTLAKGPVAPAAAARHPRLSALATRPRGLPPSALGRGLLLSGPASCSSGWCRRRFRRHDYLAAHRLPPERDALRRSLAPLPALVLLPRGLAGRLLPLVAAAPGGAGRGLAAASTASAGARLRFALCWVLVTLLFFSVSPAKRTVYILTMYPALALLARRRTRPHRASPGRAIGAGSSGRSPRSPSWPRSGSSWSPVSWSGARRGAGAVGHRSSECAAMALIAALACTLRPRRRPAAPRPHHRRGGCPRRAAWESSRWSRSSPILPRFDAIKSARALSHELRHPRGARRALRLLPAPRCHLPVLLRALRRGRRRRCEELPSVLGETRTRLATGAPGRMGQVAGTAATRRGGAGRRRAAGLFNADQYRAVTPRLDDATAQFRHQERAGVPRKAVRTRHREVARRGHRSRHSSAGPRHRSATRKQPPARE